VTLNPGESCQFFYNFSPTTVGPATATSSFTLNGEAFSVELTGTGVAPQFLVTPTGLDFGNVQVGQTSPDQVANVKNIGTAPVTITGTGGGVGAPFFAAQNCASVTLNPGESCQFFYNFSPTTGGPATATSSFTLNGQAFSVELTGTGVSPNFLVTPIGLDFGNLPIGMTSPDQVTHVTNVGPAPVTIAGTGGGVGAPFFAAQNCASVTLNPGESCQFFYSFSPTSGGPFTGTSAFTLNGVPFSVALSGFGTGDNEGPVTSGVMATPNPAEVGTAVELTAHVDDGGTGGSTIRSAEYSIDGGAWMPMNATDLAFDEPAEDVMASITAPAVAGVYDVCVRGMDNAGNVGLAVCAMLAVYDPDGGFVTGGGWFASPPSAFVGDPTLTGRATFGFVSKYQKGASTPDGNTEFQFRAAALNFHSSGYEFLVVTHAGTYAQFKGTGTINGMSAPNGGDFRFMIWAGDDDPDTFRIRIWWEDAGMEYAVYDNGKDQPLGGGSIVVHP